MAKISFCLLRNCFRWNSKLGIFSWGLCLRTNLKRFVKEDFPKIYTFEQFFRQSMFIYHSWLNSIRQNVIYLDIFLIPLKATVSFWRAGVVFWSYFRHFSDFEKNKNWFFKIINHRLLENSCCKYISEAIKSLW